MLPYYLSNYLLACHIFFLVLRSSLKEVCCIPIAYRFSMLGFCFALFTACYPFLLSSSLLLATFFFLIIRSLLFARYLLLAFYGLSLLSFSLIAACCSLINACCLVLAGYIWFIAKRW